MIDISNAHLSMVAVHHCGNQTNQEELTLSKSTLAIEEDKVRELLTKFFLNSFRDSYDDPFIFLH